MPQVKAKFPLKKYLYHQITLLITCGFVPHIKGENQRWKVVEKGSGSSQKWQIMEKGSSSSHMRQAKVTPKNSYVNQAYKGENPILRTQWR